jgi:hypothetical protein
MMPSNFATDNCRGAEVELTILLSPNASLGVSERRMERVYPTPLARCDREADYRHAWAEFERRLGKKISEGGET